VNDSFATLATGLQLTLCTTIAATFLTSGEHCVIKGQIVELKEEKQQTMYKVRFENGYVKLLDRKSIVDGMRDYMNMTIGMTDSSESLRKNGNVDEMAVLLN
jgi:hypothetical protein